MSEMSSNQLYREREAMRARAAEENQRLYDLMQAAKARQRTIASAITDRERIPFMSRVKSALSNKFSRRRESYDSEGSGPWAKSLHRSTRDRTRRTNRGTGTQGSSYNRAR